MTRSAKGHYHRPVPDASRFHRLDAELARWSRGVLSLNPPVRDADLAALQESLGQPVPADYVALLRRFDGADLRGDRMLSASESLSEWESMPSALEGAYRGDPDWAEDGPPRHLLPIATDLEGNLKCLDLATPGPEVVDWHRETGEITTWHRDVVAWIMTCVTTIALRFDHRGRPRPIRGREAETLPLRELRAHLAEDPEGSYPRMELGRWLSENGTPEEALFAFREAAVGQPERALCHYLHGRWALIVGRRDEAKQALRRALAVPKDPDPKKHTFRSGHLWAAHTLLAALYDDAQQRRKADEQRAAADRAAKRYGSDWYAQSDQYLEALRALRKGDSE